AGRWPVVSRCNVSPTSRCEGLIRDAACAMHVACRQLQPPYFAAFATVFWASPVSGDSGRHFSVLASPSPRPERDELAREAATSRAYRRLAARLGYSPEAA